MKNLYDDDEENGFQDVDKAKILVTIIPFVLIIIILAITLLANSCSQKKKGSEESELQESIMDYADENFPKDEIKAPTPLNSLPQEEPTTRPNPTATPSANPTPYKEAMKPEKDYSKISFHTESQLKEMMTYWEGNHQKALDDLANLDHFKAMSWSLKGTKQFYFFGAVNGNGQPHGKGIAVYADNQYYYGDWQNGLRSGKGTWIHYHIHEKQNLTDLYSYHQYTGGWKNDLPDGEGSEHYDYHTELFEERKGYNTNLIGTYKEGLVHGEFYLTNLYSDENVKEWYAQADMGTWIQKGNKADPKGNFPVYVDVHDDDNYVWMHPKDNKNIGVPCLISPNKN